MNLEAIESIIRWIGGLLAYITLGVVFYGIWRGTQRQVGRVTGQMGPYLRSPWFYLVTSAIYFGVCFLGWIPLPLAIPPQARFWTLVVGSLLYFPGMALTLWGRLALGKNYFVSTGFGAQVFANQQMVTRGPFAIVRHPMYSGLILAALGSLLIYHTWTTLLFACFSPALLNRARREEATLAAEFGEQWQEYYTRVPAFFPRLLNIPGQTLLILSAACSFTVALMHLAAIFIGPAAYRLLGAGEDFAAWAETGSIFPTLITLGLVGLFAIFGCYALSGAGILRRLPLLALGLLGIAAIYTLRGALLFVEVGLTLASLIPLDSLNILYSTISLVIGLLHFVGIKANRHFIRYKA